MRLLKPRLKAAIENGSGLSPRQCSLLPGHSTIDALKEVTEATLVTQRGSHCSTQLLLLATLDIKNAFNSLRWNDVLNALEYNFSVPSYILVMISNYLKHTTSGATPGSILGPDLWNVN